MQYARDDAPEAEQWKRKYYDSLEQVEHKESQWREIEDLLRKTISRITLAADGQDKDLDVQLKQLRDAIRDRADHTRLRQHIETVSRALVKLDEKRVQRRETPGPADGLRHLLDQLELPKGTARKVKKVRKLLDKSGEGGLDDLVQGFSDLIEHALNMATADGGTSSRSGGLFGRLFGRDRSESESSPKTENSEPARSDHGRGMFLHVLDEFAGLDGEGKVLVSLRKRAMRADSERDLQQLARELVKTLHTSESPEADVPVDSISVKEILLQLLEQLQLPEEQTKKVASVKKRLETPDDAIDYPAILEDIASLVVDMRNRVQKEKQDIEKFLEQLTDRLQQIDHTLQGSQTMRKESLDSSRSLDAAVQDQVRGIETSVRDAADLDQLKEKVQSSLETILVHMKQHTGAEEDRHQQMEQEMEELNGRLKLMEIEADGLRDRMLEERQRALTDPLTGIPNRMAFDERIEQEYDRWKDLGTPLTLLVWDIDRFKTINDTFGHKAGDNALRSIARRLADGMQESDFLARFGGEEFVLIMPGADQAAAREVADKLREKIAAAKFHYRDNIVDISISCGVSEFRSGDEPVQVFERADKALYRAKENGRNRIEVE